MERAPMAETGAVTQRIMPTRYNRIRITPITEQKSIEDDSSYVRSVSLEERATERRGLKR